MGGIAISLPHELVDQILDHLWDDPLALKSCSLTCRAWLPTTRYHLFETIRIRSRSDFYRLTDLLANTFPLTPEAHLSHYIRSMIFQVIPFIGDSKLLSALYRIRLQNVTHIQLHSWPIQDLPTWVIDGLHVSFPHLSSLDLEKTRFKDVRNLQRMIVGFPKLTHLRISDLETYHQPHVERYYWDVPVPEEWTRPKCSFRKSESETVFQDLDIHLSALAPYVCSWLQRNLLNHPLRLRTLRYTWPINPSNLGILKEFFQSAGPSLEFLQFAVFTASDTNTAILPEAFTLLQMDSLRILGIGPIILHPAFSFSPAHLSWIPFLLFRAQEYAHNLETIRLSMSLFHVQELGKIGWPAIDRALLGIARKRPGIELLFTLRPSSSLVLPNGHAEDFAFLLMLRLPLSRPVKRDEREFVDEHGRQIIHLLFNLRPQ